MMTNTKRLDKLTAATTAWNTWRELVTACRDGHVPSLRHDNLLEDFLGEALEAVGLKVYWGD